MSVLAGCGAVLQRLYGRTTQSGSHKYQQEARPYEEKVRVSEEDLRALYARPTATGREHVRPEGP